MNRQQLKTLINEAIQDVLNEKTPKGFDPELKKQILKQYPGEPDKAYATMQKIHKDTAAKKKKNTVKEQEEPSQDPQAAAEPDAGEMEGPESQDLDADPIMAQIDSIIGSLNSLKSKLSGETEETDEEPEGEEETD